jgi:hypothetical protein
MAMHQLFMCGGDRTERMGVSLKWEIFKKLKIKKFFIPFRIKKIF